MTATFLKWKCHLRTVRFCQAHVHKRIFLYIWLVDITPIFWTIPRWDGGAFSLYFSSDVRNNSNRGQTKERKGQKALWSTLWRVFFKNLVIWHTSSQLPRLKLDPNIEHKGSILGLFVIAALQDLCVKTYHHLLISTIIPPPYSYHSPCSLSWHCSDVKKSYWITLGVLIDPLIINRCPDSETGTQGLYVQICVSKVDRKCISIMCKDCFKELI